ncbi:MAG TPA: tRNA (adenosine(37)-N6)-threonylcarbamoyltransferase complex ATPase subunit type 1 TsaE [Vicinamibacterales bacterium]
MTERAVVTAGEEETVEAGERLADDLAAGDVVLLHGRLGAGKTAFVRGLARGLGADAADVSSPTFTLIQQYDSGRVPLFHVDLYRLEPAEVDDLGLDELIDGGGIVAIEWAERWRARPVAAIDVTIEESGEDRRRITIRSGYSTR